MMERSETNDEVENEKKVKLNVPLLIEKGRWWLKGQEWN